MNGAVKHGLIIGLIGIAFTTLTYLMGPEAASGPLSYVVFAVTIGLLVYFGIQGRKDNGGYFSFGEAFKYVFITAIVGTVISFVFQYVLYGIIDPSYYTQVGEMALEKIGEMYESMGMDQEQIDAAMEQAKGSMGYSIKNVLIGLGGTSVFYAVVAAIIGAIIKKQNPEEGSF
ncbi:MAG: hypothetical protein ACI85I_000400 [Arenicella sp.]|jgi:hypothetical protein